MAQIVRVILELWLTFAVIIGIFALISRRVGPVTGDSPASQLAAEWARVHTLPALQRGEIYVGLLLAIAVFVHFLWSWQVLQREIAAHDRPSDGGIP